ncbi:MAG: hypothetical protein LBG06_02885, partial [Deltaproteobacteria bacterium]|nr:hypothetical protein [Deltaproteobacteria bacterium]
MCDRSATPFRYRALVPAAGQGVGGGAGGGPARCRPRGAAQARAEGPAGCGPRPQRPLAPLRDWRGRYLAVLIIMFHLPIVTRFAGSSSYATAIAVTVAAAVPVFLSLAYCRAVRAAILFQNVDPRGRIARLHGNRTLANFLLFLVSLSLVCGLLLNLAALKPAEWIPVLLSFPVFLLAVPLAGRLIRREPAPWLHGPLSVRIALFAAPLVSLLAFSLLSPLVSPPVAYPDVASAVAARGTLFPGTGSSFLRAAGAWHAMLGGFSDYLLAPVFAVSPGVWLAATLLSACSLFFGLGALAAYAFIPRRELRRVFAHPLALERPLTAAGVLFQGALPALAAAALFAAGAFALEAFFAGEGGARVESVRLRLNEDAVMIAGEIYRAELVAEAAGRRRALEALAADAREGLRAETDRVFAAYEANVDSYLDWYYSLPAEYSRLAAMAAGEAEEFLAYNLGRLLSAGVDLSGIERISREFREAARRYDLGGL